MAYKVSQPGKRLTGKLGQRPPKHQTQGSTNTPNRVKLWALGGRSRGTHPGAECVATVDGGSPLPPPSRTPEWVRTRACMCAPGRPTCHLHLMSSQAYRSKQQLQEAPPERPCLPPPPPPPTTQAPAGCVQAVAARDVLEAQLSFRLDSELFKGRDGQRAWVGPTEEPAGGRAAVRRPHPPHPYCRGVLYLPSLKPQHKQERR